MGVIKKKICLIGAFAVGKTSLVERYVHSRFDEKYLTTIGVKVSQKFVRLSDQTENEGRTDYQLLIWDIAGMEKFDSTIRHYFQGAAGAVAVADLTRPETILRLVHICDQFKHVNPEAVLTLVGNKLDIFDKHEKTLSELEQAALHHGAEYLLASAKTGEQVEAAFDRLVRGLQIR